MHGVVVLAVFAFTLVATLAITARRPILAAATTFAGAAWPVTLVPEGASTLRGVLILAAALLLLAALRPGRGRVESGAARGCRGRVRGARRRRLAVRGQRRLPGLAAMGAVHAMTRRSVSSTSGTRTTTASSSPRTRQRSSPLKPTVVRRTGGRPRWTSSSTTTGGRTRRSSNRCEGPAAIRSSTIRCFPKRPATTRTGSGRKSRSRRSGTRISWAQPSPLHTRRGEAGSTDPNRLRRPPGARPAVLPRSGATLHSRRLFSSARALRPDYPEAILSDSPFLTVGGFFGVPPFGSPGRDAQLQQLFDEDDEQAQYEPLYRQARQVVGEPAEPVRRGRSRWRRGSA